MKLLYLYLFFVYAYALKPKEQPSGFFNFSRINNITLPSKSSIDSKLYIHSTQCLEDFIRNDCLPG